MTTNIDGSQVSDVTIDGAAVQEITMDGDVVFSAYSPWSKLVEEVDGFEDGDVSEWTEYQSQTINNGTLVAQQGTVINGDYSGELSGDNIESRWKYDLNTQDQQRDVGGRFRAPSRSGSGGDEFEIGFMAGGTRHILEFEMDGGLAVRVGGSASGASGSWNTGQTYGVEFQIDWSGGTFDTALDGTVIDTDMSLDDSNGVDAMHLGIDTHNSETNQPGYFDDFGFTTN